MLGLLDKPPSPRSRALPHRPDPPPTPNFARGSSRTRQPPRAIRHLWEPLVLATLNDTLDNCSMKYAGKVFYEFFLANATGGRLGIPSAPAQRILPARRRTRAPTTASNSA